MPSSWYWNALSRYLRVFRMFATVSAAVRTTRTGLSNWLIISLMRMGYPMVAGSRPSGLVCVFWYASVVGAIWPPVMP